MRNYANELFERVRRASLPVWIASLLSIASLFVSLSAGLVLCGISTIIAILETSVWAKRRRIKAVLGAINTGRVAQKISALKTERENRQAAAS